MANITIPIPELQISFSKILQKIRGTYLQEALSNTIDTLNLSKLDNELNEFVPEKYLKALINSAIALTDGIGADNLNGKILDDLTLLTIGPQLRGGANVERGSAGIVDVFNVIYDIVEKAITLSSSHKIELENAAGRKVLIEFSSDPDIVIREKIGENRYRNIVSIEVKGGKDFSNIHNRVGEAEKSHQKAKQFGYVECWTVVNVERIDIEMAKRESPSTNSFYIISHLNSKKGNEYQNFKEHIISLTGIKL